MQVLRKLSEFSTAMPRALPPLRQKKSSYKPATRLEKIKQNRLIYPSSTEDRFVFISNMDGTGFQRETYPSCPARVPIEEMVNAINVVCYKQWQKNRDHHQRNPFGRLDKFTNLSMGCLIILWIILYAFILYNSTAVSGQLYVFIMFIIGSTVVSLMVFFQKADDYDSDTEIIRAIKGKLAQLNIHEKERSSGHPQFEWTSHKECLWICLKLLQEEHLDC